jgi:hypothetical protein
MSFTSPRVQFLHFSTCILLFIYSIMFTEASIVIGPLNTAGNVGSAVALTCINDRRTCQDIYWNTVDVNGKATFLSSGSAMLNNVGGRYSVNVTINGECRLTITGLQLSDAGEFSCQESVDGRPQIKRAVLSVLESAPSLVSNVSLSSEIVEGDIVNISCSVKYSSKSQAVVSLNASGQLVQSSTNITKLSTLVTARRQEPFGPFKCIVTFQLLNDDSGELATNLVQSENISTAAKDVLYTASNLKLSPDVTLFRPGVSVTCLAEGNPEPTYQWLRRTDNATMPTGQVLTINESSDTRYQCFASNPIRGETYTVCSSQIEFNETAPELILGGDSSISVPMVIVISVLVPVIIIIIIFIIIFCWFKNKNREPSDAESKRNRCGMMSIEPPSHESNNNPIVRNPPPHLQPVATRTDDVPLDRYTGTNRSVADSTGSKPAAGVTKQPPPNVPSVPRASARAPPPSARPDVVPPRPNPTPPEPLDESEQIIYAEIEKEPPKKPPRTPISDTVYAPIQSA